MSSKACLSPATPKTCATASTPCLVGGLLRLSENQHVSCPQQCNHSNNTAALCHRYSMSDDDSGCMLDEYGWVPIGVTPDVIHHYFAALPENRIPYVNSAGERWRTEQLIYQLPAHDSDERFCRSLCPAEGQELRTFADARRRYCLGRGQISQLLPGAQRAYCYQCKEPINANEVAITAPEHFDASATSLDGKSTAGSPTATVTRWHARCFVCVKCEELLVDLIYFYHDQNVFCGRHHAELIKPRCAACDELIFSEECTEAEGRVWHLRHFACAACGQTLGDQRYVTLGSVGGKPALPLCVPCYKDGDLKFQLKCVTCGNSVRADRPHISQGEMNWHADVRCFCCSVCKENLLGRRYFFANGRLYCGSGPSCGATNSTAHGVPSDRMLTATLSTRPYSADNVMHNVQQKLLPPPPPLRQVPPPPSCPLPRLPPPPPPPPETFLHDANNNKNNDSCSTSENMHLQQSTQPENIYETVMTLSSSSVPSPLLKTFGNIVNALERQNYTDNLRCNKLVNDNSPMRSGASSVYSIQCTGGTSSSPSAASASSLQRRRVEMEMRQRAAGRRQCLTATSTRQSAVPLMDERALFEHMCESRTASQLDSQSTPVWRLRHSDIHNQQIPRHCCPHNNKVDDPRQDDTTNNRVLLHQNGCCSAIPESHAVSNCKSEVSFGTEQQRLHVSLRQRRRYRSTCSLGSLDGDDTHMNNNRIVVPKSARTTYQRDEKGNEKRQAQRRRYRRHLSSETASTSSTTADEDEEDTLAEYLSRLAIAMRDTNYSSTTGAKRTRSVDGRRSKTRQRHRCSQSIRKAVDAEATVNSNGQPAVSTNMPDALFAIRQAAFARLRDQQTAKLGKLLHTARFQNIYSKMPPYDFNHDTSAKPQRRYHGRYSRSKWRINSDWPARSIRRGYVSTTTSASETSAWSSEDETSYSADTHRHRRAAPVGVRSCVEFSTSRIIKHRRDKPQRKYLAQVHPVERSYQMVTSLSSQELTPKKADIVPKISTAKLTKNRRNASNCIVS